jgi:hypothetical protein
MQWLPIIAEKKDLLLLLYKLRTYLECPQIQFWATAKVTKCQFSAIWRKD